MIETIAAALEQRGYTNLTPVQAEVTRPEYEGADLLVSAQTGSGKTVGFGIAIAPTLLDENGRFGPPADPLALIIAPTRELAMQVKRELAWLYEKAGAVVASCVGGMDMRAERNALERGAHIVVATPGRLCDHIKRGSFETGSLRAIVLDEADEMLDLGFREDLEFILGEAPEDRRTLMFSATVPRAIATLAKQYQRDAIRITTAAEQTQHADIEYRALIVNAHDAEHAVINVLRFYEAGNALVFCNTREAVNRLTTRFSNRGFSVVALSGELSQNERSHALQAMRDGRARVCVATDVAARGIDLPGLDLVIHADLPSNAETLLHRSGRTGRAGRKGVSALIVPTRARRKAERLLQWAKVQAEWAEPPSAADVLAKDEERLLSDPVWQEELTDTEREFAGKLLASHSPEQIAAAYLRLYNAKVSAPEELSSPEPMASPRDRNRDRDRDRGKTAREQQPFGDSVWFSISIGRLRKAEPRWLLPMLCRAGNITAKSIGAIRIQDTVSFVEIDAHSVDGFQASVGPQMQLESSVRLTRLDGPPDLSAASMEPAPQQERSYRKREQGHKPKPRSGPKQKWQAREAESDDAAAKPKPKPKWQARDASADGDAAAKPKPKPKWQSKGARAEDPKPKRKLKKGGKQPPKFKGKSQKRKPREG
jgi:ATP-dependent RNA helicase DeaD